MARFTRGKAKDKDVECVCVYIACTCSTQLFTMLPPSDSKYRIVREKNHVYFRGRSSYLGNMYRNGIFELGICLLSVVDDL